MQDLQEDVGPKPDLVDLIKGRHVSCLGTSLVLEPWVLVDQKPLVCVLTTLNLFFIFIYLHIGPHYYYLLK